MAKLPKFTLTHNEKKDRWDLTKDGSSRPSQGRPFAGPSGLPGHTTTGG